MNGKRSINGACLFLMAVMMNGRAEPEPVAHRLPDVVVRPERNLLLEPSLESPALEATRIEMDAGDLQAIQPASASDALKMAPGIHTETRGRKFKQFHSFRGQVYPYPDVVLDGMWQRDARELFYVYPGAALESIEIQRSAATLFSGLADVVGVIDLVPHRPRLGPETPLRRAFGVEAGSYGSTRGYGMGEFQPSPSFGALAGGQYYRTEGRSGRNAAEALGSAFGRFVYELDPDHRLELGSWFLHGFRELEMPDPDGPGSNALKNRKERYDPLTYGHLNLRGFHRWSERYGSEWRLFYSDRQARYIRRKIDPEGPGPGDVEMDEDDREYGAQFIQALSLTPRNTLRFSVFGHRWTAPDGKHSYAGSRQDVSSYALVVADEQRVGAWTFDMGIRYARSYYHHFSHPAFDVTGQSTEIRAVTDSWDDPVLSGTAGAVLDVNARNRVFAHAGMGERRPGPGAVRADGSSPDTERRITADAGWTGLWGAGDDGRLSLTGFGVWRMDAVTRVNETGVDAMGNEFYFSGNQDIRQRGLELAIETPRVWNNRLMWRGDVTWLQAENKHNGSYTEYTEIPSLIASLAMRAEMGVWDGALTAKYVNDYENFRFAQDGNYHDLGDYLDVTLSGGMRLGSRRQIRLYGIIDNLLDDDYSTVVGWTDPGRRFRVGLETAF